jgi:hypothetical protein
MNRTTIGTARRFALTLTVAGAAALGSIAIAPAASAAPSDSVEIRTGNNGPDAFVILEHGKMPVFECDTVNENKRHNNCIDTTGPTRF